ncbi:MAG TPA: PP2C family protein-serine/threonine phosphatase [Candidatus Acidoferrum sp.]|nr:PP2C family protein-serine/threonine phosphatase [Candidatus Acidoferrum sp.]
MTELHRKSPAFRQALRKSERLRIYILLASIAFILLLRGVRTSIAPTPENVSTFYTFLWLATAFGLLEIVTLLALQRAIREARPFAGTLWYLNILVEFSIPAIAISAVAISTMDPAYRPLANPSFLIYFLLLTLSTLRLNPALCVICGIFASSSYLAAAYRLGWRPIFANVNMSLYSPEKNVITYAIALTIGGIAAGVVAREFRNQVEAALREAETRREMEHLQHDLDVARSIQQSLLPHSMPQVSGWDIAAWNQPADQTGGDYYDWQPLPNGKYVTALADVTGHGIGPALLASVCRAYARANFRSQDTFLKAMEEINSAVAADVKEGRFITFVAAIFGPDNSTVELLSAGHAPLFLYWLRHDRFDVMKAQGLPLGISDSFLSEPPRTLEFAPGDLLVLATDGFFEWANAQGDRFGTERLEKSVREACARPAAEIISTLYQDVLKFAGGTKHTKQMDDLTAIILKRV